MWESPLVTRWLPTCCLMEPLFVWGLSWKKVHIISNSNQFHACFASSSIYIYSIRPKIFFNVLIHARRCSPSPWSRNSSSYDMQCHWKNGLWCALAIFRNRRLALKALFINLYVDSFLLAIANFPNRGLFSQIRHGDIQGPSGGHKCRSMIFVNFHSSWPKSLIYIHVWRYLWIYKWAISGISRWWNGIEISAPWKLCHWKCFTRLLSQC